MVDCVKQLQRIQKNRLKKTVIEVERKISYNLS